MRISRDSRIYTRQNGQNFASSTISPWEIWTPQRSLDPKSLHPKQDLDLFSRFHRALTMTNRPRYGCTSPHLMDSMWPPRLQVQHQTASCQYILVQRLGTAVVTSGVNLPLIRSCRHRTSCRLSSIRMMPTTTPTR